MPLLCVLGAGAVDTVPEGRESKASWGESSSGSLLEASGSPAKPPSARKGRSNSFGRRSRGAGGGAGGGAGDGAGTAAAVAGARYEQQPGGGAAAGALGGIAPIPSAALDALECAAARAPRPAAPLSRAPCVSRAPAGSRPPPRPLPGPMRGPRPTRGARTRRGSTAAEAAEVGTSPDPLFTWR